MLGYSLPRTFSLPIEESSEVAYTQERVRVLLAKDLFLELQCLLVERLSRLVLALAIEEIGEVIYTQEYIGVFLTKDLFSEP